MARGRQLWVAILIVASSLELSTSRQILLPQILKSLQSTTCVQPPPLQTSWQKFPMPKNGERDFGPPNVSQGKAKNGQPKPKQPSGRRKIRNLILVIPDGFGPASEVFARDFIQWNNTAYGWNHQLASDTIQIGSVRTRSSDTYITDSSAAGTAYSCAIKTYNGAAGVDENGSPCGTVLEAAKLAGYKTGLVVTSHMTDATPATFASHIYDRNQEDKIALQLNGNQPLGRVVDLMFGGGLVYFLPNTTAGSARPDSQDLIQEAKEAGVHTLTSRAEFDNLNGGAQAKLPMMGLFAPRTISYEIDRDPSGQPSLLEMTKTALETLKRGSVGNEKGFFIMIEASRIDMAAHANDLIGHLSEIIMYNRVVEYVKEFVDQNHDTVLIGAADHECGGLTLGGIVDTGEYQFNPAPLADAKHSAGYLADAWAAYNGSDPDSYLNELFKEYGINNPNSTEFSVAKEHKSNAGFNSLHFGQSLTRQAMVKWASIGHTGVDVNLIGYGLNAHLLAGNRDNTEIGQFIAEQLGLDLPAVTEQLNDKKNEEWLINEVGRDKVEHGVKSGSSRRSYIHQH
ncbi:alkaline phosphatase-like protein [Ceratobasidium sp. AG-I]|nr:alkaline phosphatase-like protein [Ceratobasidium sp. AG-I]